MPRSENLIRCISVQIPCHEGEELDSYSPQDIVSKIVMTMDWKWNAHQRDRWRQKCK